MNILIADDHRLFLEGLRHLLLELYPDSMIDVVGNGLDALEKLTHRNQFDLALLDLKLPGMDGFTLLTRLTEQRCLIPVLVISSSEDPEDIHTVMASGASGFVSKSFSPAEMRKAIDTILLGDLYLPQHLLNTADDNTQQSGQHSAQRPDWARQHNMTARQLEVLRLVKNGYANREIASRLLITERTVKAHIQALFENLDAQNRTTLVRKASQLGLD